MNRIPPTARSDPPAPAPEVYDFLEREHDRLCRLIAVQIGKLGGNFRAQELWEQANEVLQETAVQALTSGGRFKAGRRVLPWLMGIAVNVIRNRFRRTKRDAKVRPFSTLPDGEAATVNDRETPPGVPTEDGYAALRAAIVQLPGPAREAVERRFFDGLDGDDLAQALGTSRGAARVRVCRALRDLRPHLLSPDE